MVFHSAGSARRDVGIAPYKVRPDSPEMVRIGDRTARVVEDADPYDCDNVTYETHFYIEYKNKKLKSIYRKPCPVRHLVTCFFSLPCTLLTEAL